MNFLRKILKPKQGDNKEASLSVAKVEEIIQGYGLIMEVNSPILGCVSDLKNLPYSKEEIKRALVIAIKITDDQKVKEILKTGYIQLADWQDGVGNIDKGIDFSNLDMEQETHVLAEKVLEQGREFEKWKSIVLAEQEQLINELKLLGIE